MVPSTKQGEILKLIHEGHLGLTKCKLRAKETVYWPGLNDQLDKIGAKLPIMLQIFAIKLQANTWNGSRS